MGEPSNLGRFGLYLAIAAIAVNAPRLVLAFLAADGIAVADRWRVALLALTGVATGIVLTGGGAYLAHALARDGGRRFILAVVWLLVLACGAVLITPLLVGSLTGLELAQVLPSSALRWTWSAVAVLAVELVAAGAMLAYAYQQADRLRAERAEDELLELARERNELRAELNRSGPRAVPRPGRSRPKAPRPPLLDGEGVPCRNGCGFVGRSRFAESGHQNGCPRRPTSTARARPTHRVEAQGLPPRAPAALKAAPASEAVT